MPNYQTAGASRSNASVLGFTTTWGDIASRSVTDQTIRVPNPEELNSLLSSLLLADGLDREAVIMHVAAEYRIPKAEVEKMANEVLSGDIPLEVKVRRYIKGDRNVNITQEEVDAFYREEKKKRHLTQAERRAFHKPEGSKCTSSLNCDDLLPEYKKTEELEKSNTSVYDPFIQLAEEAFVFREWDEEETPY